MRARCPDEAGFVVRDGVSLGYEVFGDGDPAVLLLPTWTIVHSRFWKLQVPYLARRHRVVTYDGPGNGRSDRITDPQRYTPESYAADAVAVLDRCGVDRAVVVGLSLGAAYGLRLATLHPERLRGLVLIGPSLPLAPPTPGREHIAERFHQPYPRHPQGWEKYNAAYWRDHYEDFAAFFFQQAFSEAHSTKPREDAVAWALETTPEVLVAEWSKPESRLSAADLLADVHCPTLVVHGTADRIQPHAVGERAAAITGGAFVTMEGSGHIPNVRDPVRFNLLLADFLGRVA